jgi:uncharacterized cupredoxin-like copper-binding protein
VSRTGLLLLALSIAATIVAGCGAEAANDDVTVRFRFSKFEPNVVTVTAGMPVRFTLRNDDPIEHEWIVGSEEVHERHRTGTEPYHDDVPTEVTVPALSMRSTTFIFDQPGDYSFVCHMPGHEAYGMRGALRVIAPRGDLPRRSLLIDLSLTG